MKSSLNLFLRNMFTIPLRDSSKILLNLPIKGIANLKINFKNDYT